MDRTTISICILRDQVCPGAINPVEELSAGIYLDLILDHFNPRRPSLRQIKQCAQKCND
ncbi:hypothetical protein TevJSym_ab01190 [endosymbiont of Tevnia jerichonana (vent Tica)]|uniref:Uncharacterized protein n=1 Tax=endosymbiont of Tevnia jerichonana (vent Tica) TaxID=1049564 RepID=G2FBT6_9GAMM|nr:hypothetical protein TevJSym_ab01190 [endosymbiont of Tevnia jerichonana (vent Tica)]